jgi:hypothetical protein
MLRQLSGESKQQHERLMEETFNKKEALILIYKNKIKDEGKEIEVEQVVRSKEIGISTGRLPSFVSLTLFKSFSRRG